MGPHSVPRTTAWMHFFCAGCGAVRHKPPVRAFYIRRFPHQTICLSWALGASGRSALLPTSKPLTPEPSVPRSSQAKSVREQNLWPAIISPRNPHGFYSPRGRGGSYLGMSDDASHAWLAINLSPASLREGLAGFPQSCKTFLPCKASASCPQGPERSV